MPGGVVSKPMHTVGEGATTPINCCGHIFDTSICRICNAGSRYHPIYCEGQNRLGDVKAELMKEPLPLIAEPLNYGKLATERASVYGDPEQSHIAIGLAWEAVFRNRYQVQKKNVDGQEVMVSDQIVVGQMFPAELVALMLGIFKVVRAARPTFHLDSYEDAEVYLMEFSKAWRQRDQE